jgi:hypothetical protein
MFIRVWFDQQLITCQQLIQISTWSDVCNISIWSVLWNWFSIHVHESDLVNSWLLVNNWHKSWFDQVFAILAPGQPWKQNHIEISHDWLYQNTGLVLTQFLLYRDCIASVFLRVCSEDLIWDLILSFLDVYHWGVGPTCQWKIIRWMTPQGISLLNFLRVIHLEWTGGGRAFIPLPFI